MKIQKTVKYNKLFLLTVFICLLALYNCSKRNALPDRGVCAHRGASNTHPENTISAFKEAIRLGAQMIEFDVRRTADSVLVVIHDKTLDRTTDGQGYTLDKTILELQSLDAGSWKDSIFSNEKIPLFSDVIDIMPRNIWLNIHIKGDSITAKRAAQIIVEKDRIHQAIFACKSEAANSIRQVSDILFLCNMERLNSVEEYVDSTIALKFNFIQLTFRSDTNMVKWVDKLKKNNIRINYYGTDSTNKFISLLNTGVDFTLTNNVNEFIEVAKELDVKQVRPKY